MSRCPHFLDCSAPLCPDEANLEKSAWFPCEEVCCRRESIDFVAVQRRIRRAGISSGTCFTVAMLRRNIPITKTLRGLDPERPRAEALESWLARHKGRLPLSEAERARRRDLIQRLKWAG